VKVDQCLVNIHRQEFNAVFLLTHSTVIDSIILFFIIILAVTRECVAVRSRRWPKLCKKNSRITSPRRTKSDDSSELWRVISPFFFDAGIASELSSLDMFTGFPRLPESPGFFFLKTSGPGKFWKVLELKA